MQSNSMFFSNFWFECFTGHLVGWPSIPRLAVNEIVPQIKNIIQ